MKISLLFGMLVMAVLPATGATGQGVQLEPGDQSWSSSSSNSISQIQMTNTPLVDAVRLVSEMGRVSIYLDHDSIDGANVSLRTPVTLSVSNSTVDAILESILPQDLAMVRQGQSIVIASKTRIAAGQAFDLSEEGSSGLVDASTMAVNQALEQVWPAHFDQMPLEMVVQMLAGPAGKHVRFDRSAEKLRFARVTLHRDNATIKRNLEDILDEAELTWEISDHFLVIRAR